MALYSLVRGRRYRFVVEGFCYSSGTFIGICSDSPIETYSPDETQHWGHHGAHFSVPEMMIAEDPVPIGDFAPGTTFEYARPEGTEPLHLVYDPLTVTDRPWKIVGTKHRVDDNQVDRRYLVRLYRPGERESWR